MASLPHQLLISHGLGLDEITLSSGTIDFNHVFYSWMAIGVLAVIGLCVRSKLKLVPTGAQNVLETVVDGLENFAISNMGEAGRKFIPILVGIFLYILTMNLFGLIPGFDAPTANINTTASMAVFVFVLYNVVGLRTWGAHYINQFTGPMKALIPLMLPLEIVSHLVRPLSLAFRLFGNIKGEEIVLIIFFMLAPLFSTLPIYFLFALAKCLQAFIFFMLTMVYLKGAVEGPEH